MKTYAMSVLEHLDPERYEENVSAEIEALTFQDVIVDNYDDFGGPLDTYTDVPRWDGGAPSRYRKHTCRKDWRQTEHFDWLDFKPRTHAHDMRRTARRVRELKESGCYGTL